MSSHRACPLSGALSSLPGFGPTGAWRAHRLLGSLGVVAGLVSFPGCMSALTATTLREALRETAASLSTPHDLDHASHVAAKKRPDDDDAGESAEESSDADENVDDMAMEEVIDNAVARLSAAGGIDPATQELLIQTLEKTPPQDWAVVVNEFAATLEATRGTTPRVVTDQRTARAASAEVVGTDARLPATGGLVIPVSASSAAPPAPLDIVGIDAAPLPPPVPTAPSPPAAIESAAPAVVQPAVPQPPAAALVIEPAAVQPAVAFIEPSPPVVTAPAQAPVVVAPMPPEPETFDVVDRHPDAPAAVADAPASGPVVNNPCFATRVRGWGQVERFPGNAFRPGQEVIVYFELDKLRIDVSEKGHTTGIDTSFRLLDATGQQVGQWAFEPIVESCPSPRRDYYVRYFVRVPENARPGRHRLEWTVTDTVGGASRQAHLDLDVVPAE